MLHGWSLPLFPKQKEGTKMTNEGELKKRIYADSKFYTVMVPVTSTDDLHLEEEVPMRFRLMQHNMIFKVLDAAKKEFPKSVSWDGETLTFNKGTPKHPAPLIQVMEMIKWFEKWFGDSK